MSKIAIVTGGNKGIGYATVKGIAKQIEGIVYLCARNEKLGTEAVENLKKELGSPHGEKIRFHQLDVTKQESIDAFRDYLIKHHDGVDILVNNAGVMIQQDGKTTLEEQNRITLGVNYYGVKNVSHAIFPLLKPHARVVVVASRGGVLRCLENEEMRKKLLDPKLTATEIETILDEYKQLSKEGKRAKKGFPNPYSMSKIAVIALARIQNRHLQKDPTKDLIVNSCCPGMVATDMTGPNRAAQNLNAGDEFLPGVIVKTIEEGADTLIYLALLPPNVQGPKGQFVGERQILEWEKLPTMKEAFAAAAEAKAQGSK